MSKRERNSLKYEIRQRAGEKITDRHTLRAYRRATEAFSVWAKENNVRKIEDVTQSVLQAYEEYLEQRPEQYTAATIHAKLAPICKAAGVSMREIRKPKRTASKIVRGREETRLGRGEREEKQERYARLVTLQRVVGIRRSELANLTGADWDGKYVTVRRGKGGKAQKQWVLPEDRETVEAVFEGVGSAEKVFSGEEMQNHLNLHRLRAEHARACYDYYLQLLIEKPARADKLRRVLLERFDEAHTRESDARARRRFIEDMNDRPYLIRGENKRKALALGLPVEYNRLALMCVSVFHLSHWRLDVTVTNYMI